MSRTAVPPRLDILRRVVEDMTSTFATKDVSEDASDATRAPRASWSIRTRTLPLLRAGGALCHQTITSPSGSPRSRKGASRGSGLVTKQGASTKVTSPAAKAEPAQRPNLEGPIELGPQYRGDSGVRRPHAPPPELVPAHGCFRLPCGTGPTINATSRYGNMLTRDDGVAGRNFLTPEVAQVARDRVAQRGGTIDPFRLFHNMMSEHSRCASACFGPLVPNNADLRAPAGSRDRAETTRCWKSRGSRSSGHPSHQRNTLAIEPRSTRVHRSTSADDGRSCALGIETKLTEPFSQNEYDGDRYRRWMRVADSPWLPTADASVHAIDHNQLWRDHLLAVALRCHPRSRYDTTRLMVVRHPEDVECAQSSRRVPASSAQHRRLAARHAPRSPHQRLGLGGHGRRTWVAQRASPSVPRSRKKRSRIEVAS